MSHRPLAFAALAVALVSWSTAPIAAQTRNPGARPIQARPAGDHPDLQGIYDVATMTPLERPAEPGNRLVLTKEEAAAMEK